MLLSEELAISGGHSGGLRDRDGVLSGDGEILDLESTLQIGQSQKIR